MGPHRAYRLWRGAGLQLPRRRPPRRVAAARPRPLPAARPNQVRAYDFVHDACASGQKLKCLTVIDEFTRECLAIDVTGSIRSARVIEVLSRLLSEHGAPACLRSDNGPEFVNHAILSWLTDAKIDTALIDPGKPWQDGADESFNGKFRDECLSMEWFRNRTEARVLIEIWRRRYNEVRPHSSLSYRTPAEFRRHHESTQKGAILRVTSGPKFPGQVGPEGQRLSANARRQLEQVAAGHGADLIGGIAGRRVFAVVNADDVGL